LFGAGFYFMRAVTGLRIGRAEHQVVLSDGTQLTSRAVLVTTGMTYRRLSIPSRES
jgi:thioredoxin reductase (NADPH)